MGKLIAIFWLHFIGDFVLQTRYLSENKSKNNWVLGLHCLIYGLPFVFLGWPFALFACLSHFPIDYVTSRITSNLFYDGKYRSFFITIGADQAVHYTILFWTSQYFFK